MGISLDEIKNQSNQLIADAKSTLPAIVGIPENAVEVPNLNSNKLQNKTLPEILQTVGSVIDSKVTDFKSIFGRVNSINGVTPDASRDITIRPVGDIQIIPDVANNELIIFGHNGINGMLEVNIVDAPDGIRKEFKLEVESGYIEGPELMLFYNGTLKTNSKDFTFDKHTYILKLSDSFPEVPDSSDVLRCFIYRNGAVNQGMLRMNYDEGVIDGINTDFVFYQGDLAPDKTLVFHNGALLTCGVDYSLVNTDKVRFIVPPSVVSYLEFINIKPYGGALEEIIALGMCDGVNKSFDLSVSGLTSASTFVWVNGILQNRLNDTYAIADGKLIFTTAPAEDSVVRVYKVSMDRNVISINGMLPDNMRNIKIAGGGGISVSTNLQTKTIEIAPPLWYDEAITPSTESSSLVLAKSPVSGSLQLWENGVSKPPSRYSVSGNSLVAQNGNFMANITIEVKYQA